MSSELNVELEHTLNNDLSNRSPENIVATSNSTRKIMDLVRHGVSVPGFSTVQEPEKILSGCSAPEEPEWMENLRNLVEHGNSRVVENSPQMVNQLTTY